MIALIRSRRTQQLRDLLLNLVARDFRSRYTDSMLGFVWAVVNPLAQLLIYYFLFQHVLTLGIRRYSSFAFIGLIAWGWFAASLNESVRVLKNSREIIEQPGFPAALLPIVTVTTRLVDFLIALPLVALIIVAEGYALPSTALLLPVVLVVQFAFTLGVAYCVAGINAALRDTQHVLGVVLQLYFFLTPIFYDLDSIPDRFMPFFLLNPMVHIVEAYRAVLMGDALPDGQALAAVAVGALVLVGLGLRVYRWARYRFLEEL